MKCLPSRGPAGEVRNAPNRLRGASGQAEIQWQLGIPLACVRLDKKGAGVSPARFCLLFPRGKSRPAERSSPEGCKSAIQRILPLTPTPAAGAGGRETTRGGTDTSACPTQGERTRKDPQPCKSKRRSPSASALAAGR